MLPLVNVNGMDKSYTQKPIITVSQELSCQKFEMVEKSFTY